MIPSINNNLLIFNHNTQLINFAARATKKAEKDLPQPKVATDPKSTPVGLLDISKELFCEIVDSANAVGMSTDEWLKTYMPKSNTVKPVEPFKPEEAPIVGNTRVNVLIDAEHIFNKTLDYIRSAEKSIQVEMFEFGNINNKSGNPVDKFIWPSKGAEKISGWQQQQKILDTLIEKSRQGVNVQVILDASKWTIDGNGEKVNHYGNKEMIARLKSNGIDVVPYPRSAQQGTDIQHDKILAVDGKKVIIGGMNWGNHSPANHDACISIESLEDKKKSEVDNIIDEVFNADWQFAWQRLGRTRIVRGPLNRIEAGKERGINKEIKPEKLEYMRIAGRLFNNPADKTRYPDNLNLLKVDPLTQEDNPKIRVLTNLPREYELIGKSGSETIGDHIKDRIDNAKSLRAELFVLSHFEIASKIIKRVEENRKWEDTNGKEGKPFDCKILVDPGILKKFPYCRKVYYALKEEGVPIVKYKTNESIDQRMHCKWAVFDEKELLIGSANWSAKGLENNINKGNRSDYPLYIELINEEVKKYKESIQNLEKYFGFKTIYEKDKESEKEVVDFDKLSKRRRIIQAKMRNIKKNDCDEGKSDLPVLQFDLNKDGLGKSEIVLNSDNFLKMQKLMANYKAIKEILDRRKTFERGNHECAVVFENESVAKKFTDQFNRDWDHSTKEEERVSLKLGHGRQRIISAANKYGRPSMSN